MHQAFLRAICEEPDDDTPRLVYADWLEENGEELRAEFVRLQCRLAGMSERNCGGYYCDVDMDYGNMIHRNCEWDRLHRRQEKLFDLLLGPLRTELPTMVAMVLSYDGHPGNGQPSPLAEMMFRRGFVASVACPLAVWLKHGPQVVGLAPVVEVRATDVQMRRRRGEAARLWCSHDSWPDWLRTLGRRFDSADEAFGWLSGQLVDWARTKAGLSALRREKVTA